MAFWKILLLNENKIKQNFFLKKTKIIKSFYKIIV